MTRGAKGRPAQARPLLAALGVVALAGLFTPAAAQTADGQATPAAGNQVEEVIVTARRRAESIQDTPVAVTAIAPSQLENAAAPDISDLEGLTPNLVIDPVAAGPGAAAISIRGISFEDIEKSFDPAVGVIIDGVYIGTNTGQLLDFFDFESVEVLRGPQGTLFGRNTTAGVINIRRTRPTQDFNGKFQATLGDYGRKEARAVLNVPLVKDQLGAKFFYFRTETDGFFTNQTLQRKQPRYESENYGITLLATPNERFDFQFTAEHMEDDGETVVAPLHNNTDLICLRLPLGPGGSLVRATGVPEVECNRGGGDDLYTLYSNIQTPVAFKQDALTAEANLDIGEFTLTSVTGLRDSEESVRQDFDASSINFFDTLREQDYMQVSQELRIAGDIGSRANLVAGLYYFHSEYELRQLTNFGAFFQFAAGLPPQTRQLANHNQQSYAAFADVDFQLTDALRLSVGGRYTKDRKKLENRVFAVIGGANFLSPGFPTNASESWSEFTPRASLDYRVNEDVLVYASYSRGFRSGGFNGRANSVSTSVEPYEPETVNSYEVGAKTEFFDRRLVLNVAAFYTKYDDKQEEIVRATPPGSANTQETIVDNAATAIIKGLEFDVQAVPVDGLTIRGALGLLDAEYDEFKSLDTVTLAPVDYSTLRLRRTPEITGSIGADYEYATPVGDLTFSAQYRYIDEYETTISRDPVVRPFINDPRGRTDVQNLVDASVTYRRELPAGQFKATLFGRNLLDDRGLGAALPVAGLLTFGSGRPPRTYGLEVGYEF